MVSSAEFLNELLAYIQAKDALHFKKINATILFLKEHYPVQFEELLGLVYQYFQQQDMDSSQIAQDYLKMVMDMRREGLYFYKNGKYSCENQSIAYEKVYSRTEIMSYYMNALLVSQILWKHHFKMFMYFQEKIRTSFSHKKELNILDIGPGHGFFSFLVKKEFPEYNKIDIVDISETSLQMTEKIIGHDGLKIHYYKKDIFEYEDTSKYDFIVLGEVIEHLDDPKSILRKLAQLLDKDGLLWVTTPTNSPALDHVYLFHTKQDVIDLIEDSGLEISDVFNSFAEDMDEATALKHKVTNLVGLFCKNR